MLHDADERARQFDFARRMLLAEREVDAAPAATAAATESRDATTPDPSERLVWAMNAALDLRAEAFHLSLQLAAVPPPDHDRAADLTAALAAVQAGFRFALQYWRECQRAAYGSFPAVQRAYLIDIEKILVTWLAGPVYPAQIEQTKRRLAKAQGPQFPDDVAPPPPPLRDLQAEKRARRVAKMMERVAWEEIGAVADRAKAKEQESLRRNPFRRNPAYD